MNGWFGQKTPKDVLAKLERDFRRLEADPSDADRAIDFFVTAESLREWELPGRVNKKKRERFRDVEILLQITSHIANGVKHFKLDSPHHKSVRYTERRAGYFPKSYFGGVFPSKFGGAGLHVFLDGDAATELGQRIAAVDLAEKVLELWRHRLGVDGETDC